ncbi:peroxiredoxin [Octadecabacter sp. 1_MG-2023]|uniref:peroxiredoxin n=1 Tax=unclassified Octadecabacter TaxID=196158 RepID=UPI001C08F821|nr:MULTISPECIES: peroxiredoxin [unclassified Octadecabacter]MBU2993494.1 peroxiredoxin [Octadecabacter sp. B2R22]MDO6733050.1 peroxiredoxin [Octadecabacter sp. 1_MG-2023]
MTEPAALLAVGDPAPDVSLPRDGGDTVTLSDIDGPVVLFFYPKDNTPGCTTEAIGFTEMLQEFAASGATVLGISKDTVKKHENFVAKHDLKIALLSDADSDTCERYGTWKSKQMYGKTFMGIERSTFLIADGKIAQIWRKVKVAGHVDEVLAAVQAL